VLHGSTFGVYMQKLLHRLMFAAVRVIFRRSRYDSTVRYDEMFGLGWDALSRLYYIMPLAEYSLAWLPVCLAVYAVMTVLHKDFQQCC
jgi:branched-subunit amino acid permease